jgi:thiamine-monophosphate kinase
MPAPNSGDTERGGTGDERGDDRHPRPGGEFAAIERLAARLAATGPAPRPGEVWIGDDAAVLDPPRGPLLFTSDLVVAGVHGDLSVMTVADFGWRAMVASLSDIAAMGGVPRHAVVAVAGPFSTDLEALYDGVGAAAVAFGCPVVGGDLSTGPTLTVAVAVTGEVPGGHPPVLRGGARPGDALFLTGGLGGAAAGLRLLRGGARPRTRRDERLAGAHLRPVPRLAEGTAARLGGARAMIDVSDGLVADLGHLATASGVGFRLSEVPVFPGAERDDALYGGEDYALVFAAPDPERLVGAFTAASLATPVSIGTCVAEAGERTLAGAALAPGGWEHPFRDRATQEEVAPGSR